MDERISIAYTEVYEILGCMDKLQVMKVPLKTLNKIKDNRKKDYITKVDKNDIFNKNNISREALSILAYLNLNYWVDQNKKKVLTKLFINNEQKIEIEKRKLYNNENIFKNRKKAYIGSISEETDMIKYKENIFIRIIKILKSVFKN